MMSKRVRPSVQLTTTVQLTPLDCICVLYLWKKKKKKKKHPGLCPENVVHIIIIIIIIIIPR